MLGFHNFQLRDVHLLVPYSVLFMRLNDENANFEHSDVVFIILVGPEKQFSTLKVEPLLRDSLWEHTVRALSLYSESLHHCLHCNSCLCYGNLTWGHLQMPIKGIMAHK